MSYYVYINGKRLPVNPEEISYSREMDSKKYRTLSGNQVIVATGVELSEISFEAEFPHEETHYTNGGFSDSSSWEKSLKRYQKSKKPVRVICSNDLGDDFNLRMLLTSCEVKEKAGEEGDKYISMKFVEYKAPSSSMKAVPVTPTTAAPQAATPAAAETTNPAVSDASSAYTVQKGDTLWKLAKQYYGDGSQYMKIAEANGIKNPNLIITGQNLTIPKA